MYSNALQIFWVICILYLWQWYKTQYASSKKMLHVSACGTHSMYEGDVSIVFIPNVHMKEKSEPEMHTWDWLQHVVYNIWFFPFAETTRRRPKSISNILNRLLHDNARHTLSILNGGVAFVHTTYQISMCPMHLQMKYIFLSWPPAGGTTRTLLDSFPFFFLFTFIFLFLSSSFRFQTTTRFQAPRLR